MKTYRNTISMSYEKEYVERHLGEPLTLALTEICLKRPKDPIFYLAYWLLHWQKNKDELLTRRKELELLLSERQKIIDIRQELELAMQIDSEKEEDRPIHLDDSELNPVICETPENTMVESDEDTTRLLDLDSNYIEDVDTSKEHGKSKHYINSPILEVEEEATNLNNIDEPEPISINAQSNNPENQDKKEEET